MSTWFISGCSTGLGRALAAAVLEVGHNAVITARDPSRIESLAARYPNTALALSLDVTDLQQIITGTQKGLDRFGTIDVLVNNAGYGYRSAIEEGDAADVERLFATNLFGPLNLIKTVLPSMRRHRSGAIVNISSIGARVRSAGTGYYAASKAALEAASGSLRKELQPLGISVIVVEPGAFRTDFAGRSLAQSTTVIRDYADTAGRRRKEHDTAHGKQPGDPAKAARAIIAVVEAPSPPSTLLLGSDARNAITTLLESERREIADWESLTTGTNVDH